MEKSYYEIALNNLDFLENSLTDNHYNDLGPMAEQIAEKMLKSVLILEVTVPDLVLKSHNLKNIYAKIKEAGIDLGLDKNSLSSLKDVYFDARYPGENYIDVNYEDCADYIKTMYDVVLAVNTYRESRGLPIRHVTPKQLNNGKSEDSIDNVFCEYRQAYNITSDESWLEELGRLFKLFNTTNMSTLAENIKDSFL